MLGWIRYSSDPFFCYIDPYFQDLRLIINFATLKNKKMEKFWKQVFVAAISSGATVQKAKMKADEAVKLLDKNQPVEEVVITLKTPFHDIVKVQTANALRFGDIDHVEDLQGTKLKDLRALRNFGEKAMEEVLDVCERVTGKRFTIHQTVDFSSKK